MIIRDIHKNSLCTQSSIGTLWTGLNHPIAQNPYSLSRVSLEAQCSKAPRFHQCSTPAARRVPAKWGNPTPLSTVPQNQVGKIVEARLRFGTAEVSGFSRPSHFRPSGKSRRFFVHRPMPPILILPQLPQPPSSISTGNNVSLVCSPCLKALTLPLPVAFHCLWFHPFLDSKESQCMANGRQVSNTDISSAPTCLPKTPHWCLVPSCTLIFVLALSQQSGFTSAR